jgi:hypothetical protein
VALSDIITKHYLLLPEKKYPENYLGSRVWWEKIQAKCKDLVKVTVKFIRRGKEYSFNRLTVGCL